MPFFQLGKVYFYTITAEIMERGNTIFDTGDAAVDQLERELHLPDHTYQCDWYLR